MKTSRLEAAKRIAGDQDEAVFVSLQQAAQGMREGSVDYQFTLGVLDEAEAALAALRVKLDTLLADGRADFAMRCVELYSSIYDTAADRVPLPWSYWQRWQEGSLAVTSQAITGANSDTVQAMRATINARYEEQLVVNFWGSQRALPLLIRRCAAASLACAVPEGRDEEGENDDHGDDDGATGVNTDLAERLAPALHRWTALCQMSEHLGAAYGAIGQTERLWLSDDVMNDTNDVAVESLLRQTYRRDLAVPSAMLPQIWSDYDLFEVDDRKRDDLTRIFKTCTNSEWMRGYKKLCESIGNTAASADSALYFSEQTNTEADALVRSWGTTSAQTSLRSLAFTMERLIEREAFPGVLNPSRLEFALHLLRSWVSHYTKSEHRWTATDLFVAKDDTDLWCFVLERHTVLLRWALLTASGPTCAATLIDRYAILDRQIDALRCVAVSALTCSELYGNSTAHSHAADEKKLARLATVRQLTRDWLHHTVVHRFGAGLLGDMQRQLSAFDDEDAADEAMLMTEGALKQMLSEVQLLLPDAHGVDTVRERLEPLIADLLESPALRSARLQRLTLRLINIAASTLRAPSTSGADDDAVDVSAERQMWCKCAHWYRQLLQAATTEETKHDGSALFVADLAEAWAATCRRGVILFGLVDGSFRSGSQDVVYERRRALKRLGL